jgi:hypothetical protein
MSATDALATATVGCQLLSTVNTWRIDRAMLVTTNVTKMAKRNDMFDSNSVEAVSFAGQEP